MNAFSKDLDKDTDLYDYKIAKNVLKHGESLDSVQMKNILIKP